jgi:hypothetical protein
MTCQECNDTGIVMVDIGTATIPDYVEATCRCQLGWAREPRGTAEEDFHPFNAAQYEGV